MSPQSGVPPSWFARFRRDEAWPSFISQSSAELRPFNATPLKIAECLINLHNFGVVQLFAGT
ncbi:hypothetical protein LB506_000359 [Fusarium annulatum]|nr:hypothetical protein LB506_000359 [Fusarium annulatum]